MRIEDPMTSMTQRLKGALADLRKKMSSDEPAVGTDAGENLTIRVRGAEISVEIDARLVAHTGEQERAAAAIKQAVAALLAAQRDQVSLDPGLQDGLVADAEAFMADGQRQMQARLQEAEAQFARFQQTGTGQRNDRT